jgi:hypothetical protein
LVRKSKGKRLLGKLRGGWEDNVKMDLKQIGGACGLDSSASGYGKMEG